MGRLDGRVALVTGAARGQGRSHAVRLAEEGADIVALDLCAQVDSVPYPLATEADLAETARQVEALGRRVAWGHGDVRDAAGLEKAVGDGLARLDSALDIVVANAGILSMGPAIELSEQAWGDVIDTNLTGVWHTCSVGARHLLANPDGGSIVIISSTGGLKGMAHIAHNVAAKHGVLGLMRTLAQELAPRIRVNSVHPTQVDTDMIHNDLTYRRYRPDLESPTREDFMAASARTNLLGVPWVESRDVSNAVLFLASDEARYITGVTLPVDAGVLAR